MHPPTRQYPFRQPSMVDRLSENIRPMPVRNPFACLVVVCMLLSIIIPSAAIADCTWSSIIGDVNGDERITPGDALEIFWSSIRGDWQAMDNFCCLDANSDQAVTPGDALMVFWYSIYGQEVEGITGHAGEPCQINTAPTATFSVDPLSGTTDTVFDFDASASTDTEDPISALQVRWDWENDGIYDTDWTTTKTASHQYSATGAKTVQLEVKDTGGLTDTETMQVNVEAGNTSPTASFTVDPVSGITGTVFHVDASGCHDNEDLAADLLVRWDWENDGTYDTGWSTTKTASYQYHACTGTRTIALEVMDTGGMTDTEMHQVTVSCPGETMSDIDGNVYCTVTIGSQVWMAENLRVTHYRNGEAIANVTSGWEWDTLSTGAYCNYNNNEDYVATCGRLYNWNALADSRGIAPAGWHVPSDDDWQVLMGSLGYDSAAGGKMKTTGTIEGGDGLWYAPNTAATNESGFAALPGGFRNNIGGQFAHLGYDARFWTSSSNHWLLRYDRQGAGLIGNTPNYGFSIRCVKDSL